MKYYEIVLSSKDRITIDEDDYAKLTGNVDKSRLLQLKKAVINPSFIVTIQPITQKEALDGEIPQREIEGHVDEKSRTFKVTKDEALIPTELKDEF